MEHNDTNHLKKFPGRKGKTVGSATKENNIAQVNMRDVCV
jgi:hypothetical protein